MGMFFNSVGIGMAWSILTVYATSLGASAAAAGMTISAFGASRVLISVPAGIVSERVGRVRVMVLGLSLVAIASLIALTVNSISTWIGCLALQGVGSACYGTAALSAVTESGTPQTRVRDMAAYQTATQIGMSLGPGLGGSQRHFGATAPHLPVKARWRYWHSLPSFAFRATAGGPKKQNSKVYAAFSLWSPGLLS